MSDMSDWKPKNKSGWFKKNDSCCENDPVEPPATGECCPIWPTGTEVIEGPLCGQTVFYLDGKCVTFNVDTKTYEEVDEVANTIGTPAPANKGENCYFELVQASICAVDAEVVLDPAAMLALVTGEVFADPNVTAVDLADPAQELIWADVSGFPCDSVVKHAEGDFVVKTAEACVESVSGDLFNLAQGGNAVLGDSQMTGNKPITIDETLTVPLGSAVRICFKVKLTSAAT